MADRGSLKIVSALLTVTGTTSTATGTTSTATGTASTATATGTGMGTVSTATGPDTSQSALVLQTKDSSTYAASTSSWPYGCPHLYFCAYSGNYYTGTKIEMYYCEFYGMPFSGTGSWVNNQTSGTVARFYNQYYSQIQKTPPAPSSGLGQDWTPVYYVKPC